MLKYYRIRMKYNQWYVIKYYDDLTIHDEALGPYLTHEAASEAGEKTGLIDMDKSDVPIITNR